MWCVAVVLMCLVELQGVTTQRSDELATPVKDQLPGNTTQGMELVCCVLLALECLSV